MTLISRRVVTPGGIRPAAVHVQEGRIRSITPPEEAPSTAVDWGDAVLLPGLIDAHTHINEPGRANWEGFETATLAAAAGGFTTLVDMPLNSSPVTVTAAALEAKRDAAEGKLAVDVGLYGGLIPGSEDHLGELIHAGVFGIKAFLVDSGLSEFPPSGLRELRRAMAVLGDAGLPLLAHAEWPRHRAMPAGFNNRAYENYLNSRPPEWELDAILLLIDLCREFACPLHIVHLANAEALAVIQAAQLEGLPVTVETCPHYLYFSAETIPDGDPRYKCAPPIRKLRHRQGLWNGLRSGLIQWVATDHSPCPPEMKQLQSGNLMTAWGGIPGLQTALPAVWTRWKEQGGSVSDLARWFSEAPAAFLGLSGRKGRIAEGLDADLVVFNPEACHKWTDDDLLYRHRLSPFTGESLYGQVQATYHRGSLVWQAGDREPRQRMGQIITRPKGKSQEGS
ncbi:MAG: allantoinase AllB [Kiritimatiellae bacterium]|nr:allantoinase AllB [Kiritimatiellia bacterium]